MPQPAFILESLCIFSQGCSLQPAICKSLFSRYDPWNFHNYRRSQVHLYLHPPFAITLLLPTSFCIESVPGGWNGGVSATVRLEVHRRHCRCALSRVSALPSGWYWLVRLFFFPPNHRFISSKKATPSHDYSVRMPLIGIDSHTLHIRSDLWSYGLKVVNVIYIVFGYSRLPSYISPTSTTSIPIIVINTTLSSISN